MSTIEEQKKFKIWKDGYGVIKHQPITVKRIAQLLRLIKKKKIHGDRIDPLDLLISADRVTSAAMWLIVHQAYANTVHFDNSPLEQKEFKRKPQGHVGGSLNMAPGYLGYMLANALTGFTRGWVMEQGHAVAAIESVNLLLDNMSDAQNKRYNLSKIGLDNFLNDFYSYKLDKNGKQQSLLGSHVNPHTGGAIMEGGYLGFAQLQYAHMPLLDERLVAFLSDGAFEEQRGGDWTPRWWRNEDCGLVSPIMIYNGRRIDQRSTMSQEGGADWLKQHLLINSYDPIIIDGRDPAAFAWFIFESERRLTLSANQMNSYNDYPLPIPYGIAVAEKGAGFYNEGTNYAHSLPLATNPYTNNSAAAHFNAHAAKLFVPINELEKCVSYFKHHSKSNRCKEKDNPLANRDIKSKPVPIAHAVPIDTNKRYKLADLSVSTPMSAVDLGFISAVFANPTLRPRVGNPDEMRSNKMEKTLEKLEFRVTDPEGSVEESVLGKVITVLNEEAIAGAAFGNKGGINIIVTYEAFGVKILGEARQEIIFAKNQKACGRPARWLSVPLVLTSHTWENGKNELSHQDPTMSEALFAETCDISRVLFPADFNTCAALIRRVYKTHGQIWTMVVAKRKTPDFFTGQEAEQLADNGGIRLTWAEHEPEKAQIGFIAIGTYQLKEILKASEKLCKYKIPHTISYIIEPGRFRIPRSTDEKKHLVSAKIIGEIIPKHVKNLLFVTHTHPEPIVGALRECNELRHIDWVGFSNVGGTLDADSMLFVNGSSWAHILQKTAHCLNIAQEKLLSKEEIDALEHRRSPEGIIVHTSHI